MTFVPICSGMPDTLQLAVPAAVPLPPRSLDHVTRDTPTLSVAVPPRFVDEPLAVYDELIVGDVIVATGRVVSPVVVGGGVVPVRATSDNQKIPR